jgi:hypothetical protein
MVLKSIEFKFFQISENTILPNILIITATPVEEDDLTSTINLILDRKIKVDVVTFSNVQSPTLLNLTPFGAVYASEFGHTFVSIYSLLEGIYG